jgi:hypothetical protein
MAQGLEEVRRFRIAQNDAFYFNWLLKIDEAFQVPFLPTHENMASLGIDRSLPVHELAANLRRVFSGIVSGNVKPEGRKRIRTYGHFEIQGEGEVMASLDELLSGFVRENRMRLPGGSVYQPCYRIVS